MRLNEALKFAEEQSASGATVEATRTMAELSARGEVLPKKTPRKTSPDKIRSGADDASRSVGEYAAKGDEEKLAAGLLGAGRNFLPSDLAKLIPAAQLALNGNWLKFLSGDADGIRAALGALSSLLPPELAQLLGKATPLLNKGLESLLKGGGDALAVGKALASGDIGGALDSVLSKYLPPELKTVYDAIKNLPGGWKKFLDDLFNNPKTPQGANGFWAARISDIVSCAGGVGIIETGLPTVLIGGFPAARVDDRASCNGVSLTDKITHGEQTVHIGGKWASRITDFTEHPKGEIMSGFPTVHISRSLGQCAGCLSAAASGGANSGSGGAGSGEGGAATISGAGINPVGEGLLGDIASGLGDMAKNKIADFAEQKAGELMQKALGTKKDEIYGGGAVKKDKSNDQPKPQPKIDDDDG